MHVALLGILTLLSLLVMVIRLTGPRIGRGAGPGPAPFKIDFPLEGWRYGTIGEAPGGGRYRLRVSVRLKADEARRIVGALASSGMTSNIAASNPAAATEGPSPEFRLLLERTGEGDFTCLRCLDGVLELVRVAGGEPVESAGKPRTSLAFLSELLGPEDLPGPAAPKEGAAPARPEEEAVTLEFHVDRSPGRWAVGLFGEELLAIPEGRPSGGEFAWSATPGWELAAKSVQPLGEIAFEDAFERESFGDESAYDLLSGEWKLDSVRDVSRSTNAFRLRGKGEGKNPALVTVGRDFWRDYRVEVSVRFPGPGTGGLVFAARGGQKLGVLRWTCPPPDRPSPEGTDPRGRALLEVVEAAPFRLPEWRSGASMPIARQDFRRFSGGTARIYDAAKQAMDKMGVLLTGERPARGQIHGKLDIARQSVHLYVKVVGGNGVYVTVYNLDKKETEEWRLKFYEAMQAAMAKPSAAGQLASRRGATEALRRAGARLNAGYAERVIVSLPWRPRLDQWYRVAVSIFEETGELEVNGRRVRFRLPRGLRSGACGLYSESATGVLFDDLLVRSNAGFVHTRGDLVGHLGEPNEGWARVLGLPDGPARLRVRPARGTRSLSLRWPDENGNDVRLSLLGSWGRGTLEMEPRGAGGVTVLGDFPFRPGLLGGEVAVEIAEDLCTVLDGRRVVARARLPCPRAGPVLIAQAAECHGGTPLGAGPTGPNYLAGGPLVVPAPIKRKSRAFEKVDVTVNRKGEKYPKSRYSGFTGWIEDRGAWDVSDGAARFRAPVWGDVDCELGPVPPKGERDDGKKRPGLYLVPVDNEKRALGVSLVREPGGVAVTDAYGDVLGRYRGDDQKLQRTPPGEGPGKRARRSRRAERERAWVEKRVPGGALVCYLLGRGHEDMGPLHGSLLHEDPDPQGNRLALAAENDVRHVPEGAQIRNGGKLFSVEAGRRLAERIKRKGVFSLEAVLAPADTAHGGPARIVSLSRDGGVRNFTLGQERQEWVVRLRTSETNENGTAPELRIGGLRPRRTHVVVTYDGEAVHFYLNGELKESRKEVRGDLKGWDPGYPLVLGNEFADPRDWAGEIRFVAFYDRVLGREEVRAAARDLPPGDAALRSDGPRRDGPLPRARRIRLRRLGDAVEASVDGETVFRARLGKSAPVRVEARGPGVGPDDLTIRAASVDESLFEAAPTEWIRWRGHWDLTDKWACDRRWSFLGLWSDAADTAREAAGLFSRASYFGDQHLHFNFAFKDMLAGKVNKRRYVRRDLNFAFSCEGEDLASGYCLLFGGFDNRGTQLLRKGELVAENKKLKFPKFTGGVGDVHWNWYSLAITRRGGDITVTMDGKTVIEWCDPEPLGGGHVAAWVLGGGMILGRTRFSAERRGTDLAGFETEASGVASPEGWRPLDRDHPAAIEGSYLGAARVTNRAGGGHFAAEFSPPREGAKAEAAARPRALAFRAGESTRVRARLYLKGKKEPAGVLPAGDGTLPADGEWHVFALDKPLGGPKDGPKHGLERVCFGSWDAEGYLAAGIGGNPAGAWYEVMLFPTLDAATRFRRRASEDPF